MPPVNPARRLLRPVMQFMIVLLGLYLYSLFIHSKGGFNTDHLHQQWLELILLFYVFGMLYVLQKPGPARGVLAAIPIFLVYLVHDVFFLVYGKVFRFINLEEVPELLQVIPLGYALGLVLVFALPLALIARRLNYHQPLTLSLLVSPLVMLALFIELTPAAFASSFESVSNEIVKYSDGKSVENNGRLAMMMYREAQRAAALEQIGPYHQRQQYEQNITRQLTTLKQQLRPRNVHMIVLESFLDPRLFKKLRFSQSPVHPAFEKRFASNNGLSISPVFGGATAQAEFEVLCGVPAFEKINSVEFNVFTGSPAWCLPGLLSRLNYRSTATNAYKPNFFNAIAGYQGAGFNELHFPVEFYSATPSYLHFGDPGTEEYLFDEQLFAQNLAFVKQHLQTNRHQPIFNYMMTIYGHTPHILDPDKRPEIIQALSSYPDDHLQRATNQFYYRTEAIANYVEKLVELDKDSLIILVADHVPPLRNGPNTYRALSYMDNMANSYYYNPLLVIENGQAKKYAPLHHYELPDLVLNYLTAGQHCQAKNCAHLGKLTPTREARLDDYMHLMAQASE